MDPYSTRLFTAHAALSVYSYYKFEVSVGSMAHVDLRRVFVQICSGVYNRTEVNVRCKLMSCVENSPVLNGFALSYSICLFGKMIFDRNIGKSGLWLPLSQSQSDSSE